MLAGALSFRRGLPYCRAGFLAPLHSLAAPKCTTATTIGAFNQSTAYVGLRRISGVPGGSRRPPQMSRGLEAPKQNEASKQSQDGPSSRTTDPTGGVLESAIETTSGPMSALRGELQAAVFEQARASSETVTIRIQELDKLLQWRGHSIMKWTAGTLAGISLLLFVFRDEVKTSVGEQSAEMLSLTLKDEELVRQAEILSKAIVATVLQDANTLNLATVLVGKVAQMPETTEKVSVLLVQALQTERVQNEAIRLSKTILSSVLQDPYMMQLASEFTTQVLRQDNVHDRLLLVIDQIAKDQETLAIMQRLFATFLEREEVQDLAKEYLKEVFGDNIVQAKTGDALWEATKYAFVPSFIRGKSRGRTASNEPSSEKFKHKPPEPPEIEVLQDSGSTPAFNKNQEVKVEESEAPGLQAPVEPVLDDEEIKVLKDDVTSMEREKEESIREGKQMLTSDMNEMAGAGQDESGLGENANTAQVETTVVDGQDVVPPQSSSGPHTETTCTATSDEKSSAADSSGGDSVVSPDDVGDDSDTAQAA